MDREREREVQSCSPSHHYQHTNTHFSTGRMRLLPPIQQCRSIKGKLTMQNDYIIKICKSHQGTVNRYKSVGVCCTTCSVIRFLSVGLSYVITLRAS